MTHSKPLHLLRGAAAEELALAYLHQQGLQCIQRNFRTKVGEIDLIMQDQQELVFVEVRYRARADYGDALDSITPKKIQALRKAAAWFLRTQATEPVCRFDVCAINGRLESEQIIWIKNAF